MSNFKHHIAVFASGSGSNARLIGTHFATSEIAEVVLVVTNRKGAGVWERAEELGIPVEHVPRSVFTENPESVLELLRSYKVDFIALAGFLLQVPDQIVDAFEGRMVNIHPALLPDFGGAGMYGDRVHAAVISSGKPRSGITIHLVNNEYDKGKIIFRAETAVSDDETVESLRGKVQRLEHRHYARVIEELVSTLPVNNPRQ